MKKRLLFPLTAIALSLSANGFAAESVSKSRTTEAQTNEAIGFGSGALAGGLVAGPVGAIVGGLFGVLIAEDVNNDNALEASENELANVQSKLSRQASELVALQKRYEQAERESQVQLVAMDKEIERVMQEMESNIQFRTASHVLESHFKPQLDLVAKGLKNNPQLVVSLSGFSDSRGDDSYNQALSEQRVVSVKDYLLSKGVSDKQVLTLSFGETQPVSAESDNEDFFFDRRVLVRVAEGQHAMTASNL
ncbi:sortase-associated OmpA-like protein PdsO [Aliiglaciecola sp. 3_MG-2023]|uniref:sortase-associated OmpA-like protein PdsO n=1 Tax=Aliiglaciecola sp. 3_MG-2023 TaxID=3062644 RepID=UPI0026E3E2BA|nr:sortase-associated OmpA-like protein PdsO [Aliiglaciecola sp. 3_MG-2023]MDO6695840.1 sortase-associated OmpA-like protein PdsO [Aliiglaciecola sp. 3_MG-2023]